MAAKTVILCSVLSILLISQSVQGRYLTRRQDQQQQVGQYNQVSQNQFPPEDETAQYEQQQGQIQQQSQNQQQYEQQQSSQGTLNNQIPVDKDDDDEQWKDEDADVIQLAVEQAEQNPQLVTGDLNEPQLEQLGQDVEIYEQELSKETELAGHKGQITVEDVQHVEEKNQSKPWYLRLKKWAGKKLDQLTDIITKY